MKLLIGSPIKQKTSILEVFLENLVKMDLDGLEVSYFFIDDNIEESSSELLKKFQKANKNVILKNYLDFGYEPGLNYQNQDTHSWKKSLIERITTFKDAIIKYAQNNSFDYLFFVDSDIIMNPQTIKHLIKQNVDIVSEVFWTSWNPGDNLAPQVWLQDESKLYIRNWDSEYSKSEIKQYTKDFVAKLKIPGLYEVGGLGACTLISKYALTKDLSFQCIPNISFWGEDRHFCIRAQVLGLKLYVDTFYPAYHIYRESYLSGVDDYIQNGFNPHAFIYNPLARSKRNLKNKIKNLVCSKINNFKILWREYSNSRFLKHRVVNTEEKITLTMVVKTEKDNNYLEKILKQTLKYVDEFVIFVSSKEDIALIKKILVNKKTHIIKIDINNFNRQKQWEETLKFNPDWLLFLDSDEIFDNKIIKDIKYMLKNREVDVYTFNIKTQNNCYKYPHLIRFQPHFRYQKQFVGRLPKNILRLNYINSDIIISYKGTKANDGQKFEDLI